MNPSVSSTPTTPANLFIKNLHTSIDDRQLIEMFSPFGSIALAKIIRHDDGQSKGFAFVSYGPDWNAAYMAIANMHGCIIEGQSMYVNIAQKRAQRKRMLAYQYGRHYQADHDMLHDDNDPDQHGENEE